MTEKDDELRRRVEQSNGRRAVRMYWSDGHYYSPILLPKPRVGYFLLSITVLLTNLLGWALVVALCWWGFSYSVAAGVGALIGGLVVIVPVFYSLAALPAALVAAAFDCWLPEEKAAPGPTMFALLSLHAALTGKPHWGQSE